MTARAAPRNNADLTQHHNTSRFRRLLAAAWHSAARCQLHNLYLALYVHGASATSAA